MLNLKFPLPKIDDNTEAHANLLSLMKQHRNLSIKVDDTANAWISTNKVARLKYHLSVRSMFWMLRYTLTGEYEDYKVLNSPPLAQSCTQERLVRYLIDRKYNVLRIPFIRETTSYINLIGIFSFGKIMFRVPRTDEFTSYLIEHNL